MIIRSRAPVRIAFGGGGTDMSPYTEQKGGVVLSSTINKYVYVTLMPKDDPEIKIISADYKKSVVFSGINELHYDGDLDLIKAVIKRMQPDYGFELFLRSDIPPNTGLGSSGAVTVALIGAFNQLRKNKLNKHEIAELAYQIEDEELKNKGGRQDQYAASFGGLNWYEFKGFDFVRVNKIEITEDYLLELEKHLVLAFVSSRGESGNVQKILQEQQKLYSNEDKIKQLDRLKELALFSKEALEQGRLDDFGIILNQSWEEKKKLNPAMSTLKIDGAYSTAIQAGALGGRVTGAGGGGCMVFYCKSNKEQIVARELQKLGIHVIDFSFETGGLKTWTIKKEFREV